jgi:hypothetical protein
MSDSHKGDSPTETSDATRLAAVSKDKKEQQTASKKHQEFVGGRLSVVPGRPIETESTCQLFFFLSSTLLMTRLLLLTLSD